MSYTIKINKDLSIDVAGDKEIQSAVEYMFTLADDFLPPHSLPINGTTPSTDDELHACLGIGKYSSLFPFDVWREHRKGDGTQVTNLPATCRTVKKERFVHSESLMWYWANNCTLAWYNKYYVHDLDKEESVDFYKRFAWLSKSTEVITNHRGIQDGWFCPVLYYGQQRGYFDKDINVNYGSRPVGVDPLLMERTVIKPVNLIPRRFSGITGYLFVTLNGDEEFPMELIETQNYRTNPELFSMANILLSPYQKSDSGKYIYLPGGHLGLNPFPHGWEHGAHTPLPNVSKTEYFGDYKMAGGINLVGANRIHLTNGVPTIIDYVPNPYNPVREELR